MTVLNQVMGPPPAFGGPWGRYFAMCDARAHLESLGKNDIDALVDLGAPIPLIEDPTRIPRRGYVLILIYIYIYITIIYIYILL